MFSTAILFSLLLRFSHGKDFSSSLISRDDSGWGWSSSGGGLQSFFDIALTALAFLSFGIFLLNLLLNALMFTGVAGGLTATGPIVTNTGGTTGGGTGGTGGNNGGTGGTRRNRSRRSPYDLYLDVDPVSAMDKLANSVLNSIEGMVQEHECVQKVFCEGNRQAKVAGRGFQYLMPVYSFGASFIGEKIGLHEKLPEHMHAILLGVDESNCQSHFPQC